MSKPFRVLEVVKDRAEMDAFEAFVRNDPACTVDKAHEWLLAKGYRISRGAVGNWLSDFKSADEVRRAAETSKAFLDLGKEAGVTGVAEATLQRFQQLLFAHLMDKGAADAGEFRKLATAMNAAVQSGRHIEKLREEVASRQQQAVEEAEKVAKGGGSGEAVANKMRELLGLKKVGGA
jgi:hypothetical protein